jgi:hypothetical protein
VDTNVLIDVERNVELAIDCVDRLEAETRLAISAMTKLEMIVGCRNKNDLRILKNFIQRFALVPFDPPITATADDLLQQYNLSHGLLIADALIAATALTIQVPLLTANRRDFDFIEGLTLFPYP